MNQLTQLLTGMSRGGWAGLIAVVALAGVVAFGAAARAINATPSQCASCHPQVTAMWQHSLGHPAEKVSCHQCHAAHPGLPQSLNVVVELRDRFIPEKYRALDERVEARCRSCHEEIVQAKEETKKFIRVNHQLHLVSGKDAAGAPLTMGCLDCHRTLAHELGAGATNRPPMRGCFSGSCHVEDRNETNCRRCHHQQLTEPGAQTT